MRKATPSLRERALGYLARREYSRAELCRKLQPHANEAELHAMLEEFHQRGWLSDVRYADQMAHARRGKCGSLKLAHELRTHGVDESLVHQTIAEFGKEDTDTARALWRKKFGQLPHDRTEWARQARYLQGRGFATSIIVTVLKYEPEPTE